MLRHHLSLTAALLALLATPHAEARTLAQIKAEGVLRVVTSGDIPLFITENAGSYSGFEAELIETLAADLGLRVTYDKVPMDQLSRFLREDRADVAVSGIGITSTREAKLDFTRPTLCGGVSVVSLDPRLNRHTDLVGKTIGVGAGTLLVGYAQKLPFEKKINVYPNNDAVVYAVISRAVDATFVYSLMQPALKKMLPKAPLHFGPELWPLASGIMLREDNDLTRLTLNAGLTRLMNNGKYAALRDCLESKESGRNRVL